MRRWPVATKTSCICSKGTAVTTTLIELISATQARQFVVNSNADMSTNTAINNETMKIL